MTTSRLALKFIDWSGEPSSIGLHFEAPSGGAYDIDALLVDFGEVSAAIEDLTDCPLDSENYLVGISVGDGSPAAVATAQRENGIRVFYTDSVEGKKYHFTIPGPEVAEYPEQGSDVVPLDGTHMAALVTAFELNCLSELGNAVVITKARFIGRRG
jgi:hypothetical protein